MNITTTHAIVALFIAICVFIYVTYTEPTPQRAEKYHSFEGIPHRTLNEKQVHDFNDFLNYYTVDKKLVSKNISGVDAFIINLERHGKRRNRLLSQSKQNGLVFNFVKAVDVKDLKTISQGQGETIGDKPVRYNNTHRMNHPAELACTLSHIKLYFQLLEKEQDVFLVMEDDINLNIIQYWDKSLLEVVKNAPRDWEMISLYSNCENFRSETMYDDYIRSTCWGSVAYLINKKGIRSVLGSLTQSGVINFDLHKIMPAADMLIPALLKSYTVKKSMFFPLNSDVINSTIHKDHNDAHIDVQSKMIDKYIDVCDSIIQKKWLRFLKETDRNEEVKDSDSYLERFIPGMTDSKLIDVLRKIEKESSIVLDPTIENTEWRTYDRCKTTLDNLETLSENIKEWGEDMYFNIPKIIHQVWIGPKEPPHILLDSVRKFTETWPNWTYKLWREKDVEQLRMLNQETYDREELYAGKSDVLRYEILWRFGGMYIDADTLYLGKRNIADLLSCKNGFFCGYETFREEEGLAGGTMGCTQYNPIMYLLMKASELPSLTLCDGEKSYITLGPYLLDKILKFLMTNITIYDAKLFYPVWWHSRTEKTIQELIYEYGNESYFYQYGYTTNGYEASEILH